ncbi:MAG: ABC transporter ATP-binding protein [Candidatus Riflebacteria bacterium]|nr:ABC transporter ATP-binding protein [Candidatus Riflebacteria bacterium]
MNNATYNISKFNTFETLVDSFVASTGVYFPKLSEGRNSFFKGFYNWLSTERTPSNCSLITPEPLQALSLPNPAQVMYSALRPILNSPSEDCIKEYLSKYGLDPSISTQPITTLSGGEMLLLNFAKAEAQAEYSERLIASNPVFWLNSSRYHHWQSLKEFYGSKQKSIDVLVLNGDTYFDNAQTNDDFKIHPLEFKLSIKEPKVIFPEIRFPIYHAARTITYKCHKEIIVKSPFLISGDNGVGKSIFSGMLSSIVNISSGDLSIEALNGETASRLVFQEAVSQCFAKTPEKLINDVFCADLERNQSALNVFRNLLSEFNNPDQHQECENKTYTLLALKIALIAERLADKPALLLLDEPGWGLSNKDAQLLVYKVSQVAHDLGVALGIVSHQPTWHKFAASKLTLKRLSQNEVDIEYESF